ncbi:helicase, partial [candidate division KSB1 bacterium]|nr:helicase [candidate division KSB1 bacterium]
MPQHDIIDNRNEKLVEHINRVLASSASARFAVGYFFLSGFTSIAERLQNLKELRLLIGNTTNRETLEQLVEGHNRLESARDALEAETFRTRSEVKQIADDAATRLRTSMESMDQTEENAALVHTLARMIAEQRLKVRIYTKGRLHAKAYVFDYGEVFDSAGKSMDRHERGLAIVGSSNLSLAGVSHNTELNVIVQGNANHAELACWFDALWEESQDFDEALMHEMRQSWAMAEVRPYDIYMKTLYTLVRDRLEGEAARVLWNDDIMQQLADFQKVAVQQAIAMIRQYRGAFVADVVGLGKSYIGAAIVKHFERTEHARPLIICPAPLVEMWEGYNETYHLNARVLSMGYLHANEEGGFHALLEDRKYRERDFVLIDESHNFRHSDTQRYKVLQTFLQEGKRCCLLTATPRNKSAWDVYNQIKLFHQEDRTELPIDPPDLREYFKRIEAGERKLPDLLYHLQIRRLRKHVLRWYGFAADTRRPLREMSAEAVQPYLAESQSAYVMVAGKPQFFPRRELETVEYSIEQTYRGLYQQLRGYLGKSREAQSTRRPANELCYARYGLWHYVVPAKRRQEPYASLQRAGVNLCGLMRILLFKRFESSVYAFRETIRRLLHVHELFLAALQRGTVATGEAAQSALYKAGEIWSDDLFVELQETSQEYSASD